MNLEYFIKNPYIMFPDGYLVVKNKRHQVVAFNETYQIMAGKSNYKEVVGLTDKQLPWYYYADTFQMHERDIMNGNDYTLRHPIIDISGEIHQLLISKKIIRDIYGSIGGTITHAVSITTENHRLHSKFEDYVYSQVVDKIPKINDNRLKKICYVYMKSPSTVTSLAEWSETIGVSERTLSRIFNYELGMSFTQFRQIIRIYLSLPFLLNGQSLSRIAQDFGYSSQTTYSQIFKKITGIPPKSFMDQHLLL